MVNNRIVHGQEQDCEHLDKETSVENAHPIMQLSCLQLQDKHGNEGNDGPA